MKDPVATLIIDGGSLGQLNLFLRREVLVRCLSTVTSIYSVEHRHEVLTGTRPLRGRVDPRSGVLEEPLLPHTRQSFGQPDDRSQAVLEGAIHGTLIAGSPEGVDRSSQSRSVGVRGTVRPALVEISENAQRSTGSLVTASEFVKYR